jgi:hypothetical protein
VVTKSARITLKITGFMLDRKVVKAGGQAGGHSPIPVLRLFLVLNLVQLALVLVFWRVSRSRSKTERPVSEPEGGHYSAVPVDDTDAGNTAGQSEVDELDGGSVASFPEPTTEVSSQTRRRGAVGLGLSVATIATSWIVFGIGYATP